MATPAGEHHELGALLAANAAMDIGWEVIYLGSDLPADETYGGAVGDHADVAELLEVVNERFLDIVG